MDGKRWYRKGHDHDDEMTKPSKEDPLNESMGPVSVR